MVCAFPSNTADLPDSIDKKGGLDACITYKMPQAAQTAIYSLPLKRPSALESFLCRYCSRVFNSLGLRPLLGLAFLQ